MKRDIWDKLIEWKNKKIENRLFSKERVRLERLTLSGPLAKNVFLRRII